MRGTPFLAGCLLLSGWLAGVGRATAPSEDGDRVSPSPRPLYRSETISGARDLERLRAEMGPEGMELLQKVNRRDLRHMGRGVVLQVPESELPPAAFSPFPARLGALEGIPKAILVSLSVQAFAGYEYGRQVTWGPISAGTRRQPTPPNLYHTNWRSPRRVSTINRSWIMRWYYNIHTSMGLAFHEYAMPGYPASYGCIRLLRSDALWLYDWAEPWIRSSDPVRPRAFGTPVVVFGEYDYDSEPPWSRLAEDPAAADVCSSELREALDRYLWAIKERARLRQGEVSPSYRGVLR